jgi:hypothetical protein
VTSGRIKRIDNWDRIDSLYRNEGGDEFIHDEDDEESWNCVFDPEGTRIQQIEELEKATNVERLIGLGMHIFMRHLLGLGSPREELFLYRLTIMRLSFFYVGGYDETGKREVDFSNLGKKGAEKRHAANRELMKWAQELYKTKDWKSANEAAHELKDLILEHGRTINADISKQNAQRTFAEWFRKSV